MENKARLVIDSLSDNIGLARVTVASFASQLNFTLAELEEIKVAISEAVSNSIIHGYKGGVGEIDISMRVKEHQLEIIIEDQGCGIEDIKTACEPAYTTADRMGLGLVFIDSFMDKFEIESKVNQGTTLKMVKVPAQEQKQVN
ncbi:anti-sigma F factor [Orenia metallireducens]|jgi:stage II sporulation protein AB (anti-sigma F factor)|uniref:Anti-sigma F factor n=1 Tax=Orenia metallireducens TaxID=1413210 RepID=A0A1C0A9P1_9FIRM|nr:anti-sigma F factor [Orenia metallireducens]OCL27002.1 anti-sigma F factor [Orenia metallireducens]